MKQIAVTAWFFCAFILLSSISLADFDFPSSGLTNSSLGFEVPALINQNPAGISALNTKYFTFSTGVQGVKINSFGSVLLDSQAYRTETGSDRSGSYQYTTPDVVGWNVGFSMPVEWPILKRRLGYGFAVSGPFQKLRNFTALTPYDFALLRYGGMDSQLRATSGISVEAIPEHLFLGAGLRLYLTAAGNSDGAIVSQNPTARLKLDIGFNTAFLAGALLKFGDTNFGLVYRQAMNPTFEQQFDGRVEVGGTDAAAQPFKISTTLYFEPAALEADVQHNFDAVKVSAGVAYQFWTSYKPPFIVVETKNTRGEMKRTQLPTLSLRNTFNPRVMVEVPLFDKSVSIGTAYQYRQTPLTDMSNEANLLDTSSHVFGLGFQHKIPKDWLGMAVGWGLYGQYHLFETRKVVKQNAAFIGAPGYEFGGHAYAVGLNLSTEL